MTIIANRVERARFDLDRVHFKLRPTPLAPGYYAIVGHAGPMTLKGYRYIGQAGQNWEECPEIVVGLDKTFYVACPDVFWFNGTWHLIVGHSPTGFKAYTWWWNKWVKDDSVLAGLQCPQDPDHPERTMECWWPGPRVFWMQGNLHLLFSCAWCWYNAEDDWHYGPTRYFGFRWEGNQWVEYPEIVEGLPLVWLYQNHCGESYADAFDVIWWDGVLRLIRGVKEEDPGIQMLYWDTEQGQWVRDTDHENGLWDHGGGTTGVQIGFGMFELEGKRYVVDSSYLSDAKEWVEDHWESSAIYTGLQQSQSFPWPTVFRVR